MRSVSVIISVLVASALMLFAILVLYVPLLSRLSGLEYSSVSIMIRGIIDERPEWDAYNLGERIREATSARYVKVNLTVYDMLSGRVIWSDFYEYRPQDPSELTRLYKSSYLFLRSTRDLYLYRYEIEVGS